jgi:hypothetical protein
MIIFSIKKECYILNNLIFENEKIYNTDIFFCNYECSKYKNSFIIYIKYTLNIFG